MRDAFIRTLTHLATENPNVILITGDLGFGVLTDFAKRFPRQFFNAGVAEQNMTSLAAGLALEGKVVFTYSIANFPILRCLEQIRNDVLYHNTNVKIVSVGAGLGYGSLGMSHHATEDLAILRALPGMTVVAPGDVIEAELATRAVYATPGTFYLRLGMVNGWSAYEQPPEFKLGKAIPLFQQGEIAFLSTGPNLKNVLEARALLAGKNIQAQVYSVPTVSPIDRPLVEALARATRLIVTVEDHQENGGLGGAVSEVLAECRYGRALLLRIGLRSFASAVGSQDYLREFYGLSPTRIAERTEKALAVL